MPDGLRFGPLSGGTVHLCVDMQTIFAERTDWHVPWLAQILPAVVALAGARCRRTIFTRFIPPDSPEQAHGTWRRYYEHWRHMMVDRLDPRLVELVPPLTKLVPPALVVDKRHYSPFKEDAFRRFLADHPVDSFVVSGTETDMCVLAAVMDAVDLGYRVVLAEDALCSVSDASHDAMLRHFRERFGQQVEVAQVGEILANWEMRPS